MSGLSVRRHLTDLITSSRKQCLLWVFYSYTVFYTYTVFYSCDLISTLQVLEFTITASQPLYSPAFLEMLVWHNESLRQVFSLVVWISATKLDDFYHSGFSDHCLKLYCYIHNISADISSGLLQVFVEFGSLHGTSNE